jgi:hypothetical protein
MARGSYTSESDQENLFGRGMPKLANEDLTLEMLNGPIQSNFMGRITSKEPPSSALNLHAISEEPVLSLE